MIFISMSAWEKNSRLSKIKIAKTGQQKKSTKKIEIII